MRESAMPSRRVHLIFPVTTALALCTSCSQSANRTGGDGRTSESSSADEAPDIAPSAAPGVAFNYNYRFNLPDQKISAIQEEHAGTCETIGLQRCRITGMSYSVDRDQNVFASLDLKLVPALARRFGKSATGYVEKSGGRLDSLQIGSSDEGIKIDAAKRDKTSLIQRISDIESQLKLAKPGDRAALIQQLDTLKAESARPDAALADSQIALAATPMHFDYNGRGGTPGFHGNPVREAWRMLVETVVVIIGFLLRAIAVLLPIALLVAGFILLWRTRPVRAARNWVSGDAMTKAE